MNHATADGENQDLAHEEVRQFVGLTPPERDALVGRDVAIETSMCSRSRDRIYFQRNFERDSQLGKDPNVSRPKVPPSNLW
jgi:hypothetical protein